MELKLLTSVGTASGTQAVEVLVIQLEAQLAITDGTWHLLDILFVKRKPSELIWCTALAVFWARRETTTTGSMKLIG